MQPTNKDGIDAAGQTKFNVIDPLVIRLFFMLADRLKFFDEHD
jgi:hypothetical protein